MTTDRRTTAHGAALRVLLPATSASPVSRRSFLSAVALAGGAAGLGALTGCGGGSASAPGSDGKIEDALSIYTWGDYDDPQVLKDFTKDVGPRITLDSFGSNEEMIAKLVAAKGTSGYDIVVPSSYYVQQMAQNGLLMELDHDLLPNLENVQSEFRGQKFDPGNTHTVVKAWGTTGFAYDTQAITRPLATWDDFFDAAQNEASGSVSLSEDPGEVVYAYLNAHGIDENTEDGAAYDEAETFLVGSIAPHVQAFDSNPGTSVIPTNARKLVQAWNGDARLGKLDNPEPDRWQWVLPAPTNLWQDNWAIASGAPHPVAAHAFVNAVLGPELSLAELRYIGYNTAVDGVQEAAQSAGVEMPEIIFFSEEQLATMTEGEITKLTPRQTKIVNKMRAAAGA